MQHNHITDLLERVDNSDRLDADLAGVLIDGLDAVFPNVGVRDAHKANNLATSGVALALVATGLPNWSIMLTGSADVNDGGWSCTIRKSGVLNDDVTMGVGKAAKLPMAMIIAGIRCKT